MTFNKKYPKLIGKIISSAKIKEGALCLFESTEFKGFYIEGIAAFYIQGMDGKKNISELTKELEVLLKIPKGKFNKDIEVFTNDLLNKKLIELNNEAQKN